MSDSSEKQKTWINGRETGNIYRSKTISSLRRPNSKDNGKPAKFFYESFDDAGSSQSVEVDGERYQISCDEHRYSFEFLIAREAGNIKDIWIKRTKNLKKSNPSEVVFHLSNTNHNIDDFLTLLRAVPLFGLEIDAPKKVASSTVEEVLNNPDLIKSLYSNHGEKFRQLIEDDKHADDVIALASRKEQVQEFEHRLNSPEQYSEAEWQKFFEKNHWILGANLSMQLLTSIDDRFDQKLEQVVRGNSVEASGKRPDALLSSRGIVNSLVFAEIKKPDTKLCEGSAYRAGSFAPSTELSGGIIQCLDSLHAAETEFYKGHELKDEDGGLTGRKSYFFNPKSYLIIGTQKELMSRENHPMEDRIKSFYLFRNNLQRPEVITYDELLARAKWLVSYNSKDF